VFLQKIEYFEDSEESEMDGKGWGLQCRSLGANKSKGVTLGQFRKLYTKWERDELDDYRKAVGAMSDGEAAELRAREALKAEEEQKAEEEESSSSSDDDDGDTAGAAMGRAARPRERRAPAAFQPGGAANRLSADAVADASGQQEADDDSADDRTACELASQPKSAYVPALFDPLPLFDPDAAQSREARAAERQQRLAPEAEEEQASDSSSSSSSSTEESSSDELPAEKSMGASGSCGREWYSALGYSRVVLEDPCCAFLK